MQAGYYFKIKTIFTYVGVVQSQYSYAVLTNFCKIRLSMLLELASEKRMQ